MPRTSRPSGRSGLLAAALLLCSCSDPGSEAASSPPADPAPGPTFFLADKFTGAQRASRVLLDSGTAWLLDEHGDFVFGVDPTANWNATTGLSLTWKQIPGAVKYHVAARNSVTSPTDWKELLVVPAPDAALYAEVVATGINPWAAGLGTGGSPWSFGNHVELVVSAEDARGVIQTGAVTRPLDTADAFPGVLTSFELEGAELPAPFEPRLERGVTFAKSLRLTFSEPMRTASPPTLTSQSANLVIRHVRASAWGTDPKVPSAAPPVAAAHAFLDLSLTVQGACTELWVTRAAGDFILVVRDPSLFAAGPAARVLFLDGTTGATFGEGGGIAAVDAALNRVTLDTPLAAPVAAGALACALSGGAVAVPTLGPEAGVRVAVSDARPFFVGEQVQVYSPESAGAPIADLRTVAGVDTRVHELLLSAPLSPGHGPASRLLALPGLGGEVTLRQSAPLALARDAAGGPDAELFVASPTDLLVGDAVLVDGDGNLQTTRDQAQATVKEVRFAPAAGGTCSLVVDLPAGMLLLHGQASVVGLGDSLGVGGTRDTTAAAVTPLDAHGDQLSPGGLIY